MSSTLVQNYISSIFTNLGWHEEKVLPSLLLINRGMADDRIHSLIQHLLEMLRLRILFILSIRLPREEWF
jgi:uncharacterized membrane-anchored protein